MRLSRRKGRIQRVRRLMVKRSHKVRCRASEKRILEDGYSQEGAEIISGCGVGVRGGGA